MSNSSLPHNDGLISWLQNILRHHISAELLLEIKNDNFIISHFDNSKIISIPINHTIWAYNNKSTLTHSFYTIKENISGITSQKLNAPGAKTDTQKLITIIDKNYIFSYDIFALAWFHLCRIEELHTPKRDHHSRFSAKDSNAYKNNYLMRPIVDEWFSVLKHHAKKIWPDLFLTKHTYTVDVSHDVDRPLYYGFINPRLFLSNWKYHFLKNKNLKTLLIPPLTYAMQKIKLCTHDSFNQFNWLMDQSESRNLKSTFYFFGGSSHPKIDAKYSASNRSIKTLIKTINKRGHTIGLHGSYESGNNIATLQKEKFTLEETLQSLNINKEINKHRFHYLRWQNKSWDLLNKININTDATLGYADHAGFRCGTAHAYPAFDAHNNKILNYNVLPLIAMECSVLDSAYMKISSEHSFQTFKELIDACKSVNGTFTLLWHNSYFEKEGYKDLYEKILNEACSNN